MLKLHIMTQRERAAAAAANCSQRVVAITIKDMRHARHSTLVVHITSSSITRWRWCVHVMMQRESRTFRLVREEKCVIKRKRERNAWKYVGNVVTQTGFHRRNLLPFFCRFYTHTRGQSSFIFYTNTSNSWPFVIF
jgi:hypothetical protein